MTTYHGTFDLDYLLRQRPEQLEKCLINKLTGGNLTPSEVVAHCAILKAQGYEVLPVCDNHDKRGHCQGHPETT